MQVPSAISESKICSKEQRDRTSRGREVCFSVCFFPLAAAVLIEEIHDYRENEGALEDFVTFAEDLKELIELAVAI